MSVDLKILVVEHTMDYDFARTTLQMTRDSEFFKYLEKFMDKEGNHNEHGVWCYHKHSEDDEYMEHGIITTDEYNKKMKFVLAGDLVKEMDKYPDRDSLGVDSIAAREYLRHIRPKTRVYLLWC